MHEYGICEGVLDAVRARAHGRKVVAIRVRFGVRHAIKADSLSHAFESVAAGTEAADAAIELVTVPVRITCRGCGSSADSTDLLAVCPRCASADVELSGGDEMTLESVTYVPEPAGSDAT
jgi:hydrogenase nickel incorporation protein HypA/HybF